MAKETTEEKLQQVYNLFNELTDIEEMTVQEALDFFIEVDSDVGTRIAGLQADLKNLAS